MGRNRTQRMGTVTIEHYSDGWRQILCSQGVKSLVDSAGEAMAARAGDGFAYTPAYLNYGGGRVGGFVSAKTYAAMRAEARDKALSMAVQP